MRALDYDLLLRTEDTPPTRVHFPPETWTRARKGSMSLCHVLNNDDLQDDSNHRLMVYGA